MRNSYRKLPLVLGTYNLWLRLQILLWVLGFGLLSQSGAWAQDKDNLDTEKQLYFFRIWGHLKYYHPASAMGQLKADSLFLANLAKVDSAKTQKQVNAVFKQLLNEVGVPAGDKAGPQKDNPKGAFLLKNLDDSWRTKSKFLSSDNRKMLNQIFERRYTGDKHYYTYIRNNPYGGTMPHEPEYAFDPKENLPYPLRMLALAKFKAFVDYLYPYKHLMDENWDAVISLYIPQFAQCETREEYERLLLGVNARLDDTQAYSFFRQLHHREKLFKNHYYPPFDYQVAEKKIVVTAVIDEALCKRSNIRRGDIIEGLDSVSVAEWVGALDALLSVSNESSLWARVGEWGDNLLFRSEDATMNVQLTRGEEQLSTTLRLMDPSQAVKAKLIDAYFKKKQAVPAKKSKGLAYAAKGIVHFKIDDTFRLIKDETSEEDYRLMDSLFTRATKAKGIIFDMRGEPDNSDFVFHYVYKKFGKKNHYFARYFQLNPYQVGSYRLLTQPEVYYPTDITPDEETYNGKVVILVDGTTQSISEWHTMSLQRLFPNSITLGEQSAGADGDVKRINLPGKYVVALSGNGIYYPNNNVTQRLGVRLDEQVHPTLKGVLAKKDELLAKAIELIGEEEKADDKPVEAKKEETKKTDAKKPETKKIEAKKAELKKSKASS
ncbi:S41 family peptidase [Rufibacter roseolus]|uniref:S41 family peptidase n=1 Tax=Rufibacter roseolus TaxID=2817375 RepID=UPI001B3053D0|nr:S41 family peptidase [Rufibacter roseolus]